MEMLRQSASKSVEGQKLLNLLDQLPVPTEKAQALAKAITAYSQRLGDIHTARGQDRPSGNIREPALKKQAGEEKPCCSVAGMQMVTPRGKHDLLFFKPFLRLKGGKQTIDIPYQSIHALAIFDQVPNDAKKRVLLFLGMQGIKTDSKSEMKTAIIQVSEDAELDIPSPLVPSKRLQGLSAIVLCQAFGIMGVDDAAFVAPSEETFSTLDNKLAVEAVVGVNQGWLFPLQSAFCFLERPALWIKHSDISHVEVAQIGSGTRSFVLYIHLKYSDMIEFNNISRTHLDAVTAYVTRSGLPTKGEEVEQGEQAAGGTAQKTDLDEDTDEDSDFDPNDPDAEAEIASRAPGGKHSGKGKDEDPGTSNEAEESSADSDSDVSVVSDEDVPSSAIKKLVADAKGSKKRKRPR